MEPNDTSAIPRNLYCVRDCKVGEYNPPCVFASDAAAVRAFGDMVTRDKDTLLSLHPEDFTLVKVGVQDIISGMLVPMQPTVLATGSDFAS